MKIHDKNLAPEAAAAPGYLAHHASRVFHRIVDAELEAHGVSVALLAPLFLLWRRGPLLQKDLVRELAVAQPAMVATLAKLQAEGFIKRARDASDGRAAKISLTPKGEKAVATGRAVLNEANATGLKGFGKTESQALVTLLKRLIVNFEEYEEKHQE